MSSKHKVLLTLIFILGMFMRVYQYDKRFGYGHDGDLASWIVKDVVVDHHIRLVGQLTSAPGIYIGPLFYYALIPFYLMFHMDPIGGVWLSVLISAVSILSLFFVLDKIHGRKMALVSTIIYAGSFVLSNTDRGVVPTTPVILWTIWFYYSVHQIWFTRPKGLYLTAFLFGLVWNFHLALALLAPISLVAIIVNIRRFNIKNLLMAVIIFVITSSPLIIFEVKHNFIQSRSFVSSFSSGHVQVNYLNKLHKTVLYLSKNANGIFGLNLSEPLIYVLPTILLLPLLVGKRRYLYLSWIALHIIFFTIHPINLSEYYLNGANLVWIVSAGILGVWLTPFLTYILIALFLWHNMFLFLNSGNDGNSYLERKALVAYIAENAQQQGFPCVAVSYMTSPGYDLGYRYFFWLKGLHVNHPDSNSPVYTIVFPHTRAGRLDATFGGLGVVLPDKNRYFPEAVKYSCSGANSNLTDPLFGFTNK